MSEAAAPRTLTIGYGSGLGNRLLLLLSGMALAEASGRRLCMLWPRNAACAAGFHDLFDNDWPVEDVAELPADWPSVTLDGWSRAVLPDLLSESRAHVRIGFSSMLVDPRRFPAHAPLLERCRSLIHELRPRAALMARIEEFAARRLRTPMIGVHLRRGDFLRTRPDLAGNTAAACAAVDQALALMPRAGVLLCSDDGAPDPLHGRPARCEGVADTFRARYGDRLVLPEQRSLDRAAPAGIEDAVVDLWLLRRTDYMIGTDGSSYSQIAVFGRDVPYVAVAAPLSSTRPWLRLLKVTGGDRLLVALGRRRWGQDLPPGLVLRRLRDAARRRLRRRR